MEKNQLSIPNVEKVKNFKMENINSVCNFYFVKYTIV